MKKCFWVVALFVLFAGFGIAEAKPEVDAFIDKSYNFSKIKSIYILPVDFDSIPGNVELSLPNLVDDWLEEVLLSKKNKYSFFIKSTKRAWQDMQLISGPFSYKDPKESREAFDFFRSKLGDACSAVLSVEVSLARNKRWIEPRVETYTEYERVKVYEKHKMYGRSDTYREVYIDKPVLKTRVIPGEWIVTAEAWSFLKVHDAKNMSGKYVAAAKATAKDESGFFHEVKPNSLLKSTLEAAVASIFYK